LYQKKRRKLTEDNVLNRKICKKNSNENAQNRRTKALHSDAKYLTTRKERYLCALKKKACVMKRHVTPAVVHPLLEWGQYGAPHHVQSQSVRTTLGKVVNTNIGRLSYATSTF